MATVKFVQAQKFSLAGSGSSIGDTTLVLQSMVGIDGANIVTADIGVAGFGTIEPGNGTQEEAIQFTGITQNANGTATLTGVSTVLFKSPYTATSGLAKTHAGATTFILSNDAAFYGSILNYVDAAVSSSGIPATNLVSGIAKLSVAAVSAPNPIVVGDNDPRILASGTTLYVNGIARTGIPYTIATGTPSALTATLASSVSTLASGTFLNVLVPITTASGVTLNVNALGAKTIRKNVTSVLASGDIIPGEVASVVYDGTSFQLLNLNYVPVFASGNFSVGDISSFTTSTIPHTLGKIPKRVKMVISFSTGTFVASSETIFTASQSSVYFSTGAAGNTFRITSSSGNFAEGVVTIDATNINITWTKTGSPTGTPTLLWEALV